MSVQGRRVLFATLALVIAIALGAALLVKSRFDDAMQRAFAHAAQGSVVLQTRCGPIEYQEAGTGVPLLAVHGSGGGHGQLPVSTRARGLRSDTALGKHLTSLPLDTLRLLTLIFSARDDRYSTDASAQYTASQIPGAKFIGFPRGGHLLVGHNDEVMAAIVTLLNPLARP